MELEFLFKSVIDFMLMIWNCSFTMFGVTVSIGALVLFAVLASVVINFLRG